MRRPYRFALPLLAIPVLWLFWEPLVGERVLYFRDVTGTYFPDYVYIARWLSRGLWPLWHASVDAGVPFLDAYPVDLLLLLLAGARATLALNPPLHLVFGMWGTYRLARDLGRTPLAALLAGSVLGLSGVMLSSVLYPNFLASAWTPWIVLYARAAARAPTGRRTAVLGLLVALQLSTLGGETVVQTGILVLALLPRRPDWRALRAGANAAGLALLVAAPALAGLVALLRGSARGAGFPPEVVLAYSAGRAVLLESVLPHLFGEVHGMTWSGNWGRPFYPGGNPYYLSLYLGPAVALVAARGRDRRLVALALLGVFLSLGAHGPFGAALGSQATLRGPIKFFFLTTLAVALLAAEGLDRARECPHGRWRWWALAPGVILLALAAASATTPASVAGGLSVAIPEAAGPEARSVVAAAWPSELAQTGAVALGTGAALAAGPAVVPWAGLLVVLDLLRVNGTLNLAADASFYDLRPESQRLADRIAASGGYRVLSYGVAHSPPLTWAPELLRRNHDVWLFYLDRQALLPRTQVLDGLDGAFDLDRMGWAPHGATLTVAEATPLRLGEYRERLRLASVRWVLSFHPLPPEQATLVDSARLDEVAEPLGLYELTDAVPRAFWAPRIEVGRPTLPAPERGPARVRYARPDPHHVVLDVDGPPGVVVVSEGFDPAWQASVRGEPVPLERANGRYWAVPTRGGAERIDVRYRPAWRAPALAAAVLGLVIAGALARRNTAPGGRR